MNNEDSGIYKLNFDGFEELEDKSISDFNLNNFSINYKTQYHNGFRGYPGVLCINEDNTCHISLKQKKQKEFTGAKVNKDKVCCILIENRNNEFKIEPISYHFKVSNDSISDKDKINSKNNIYEVSYPTEFDIKTVEKRKTIAYDFEDTELDQSHELDLMLGSDNEDEMEIPNNNTNSSNLQNIDNNNGINSCYINKDNNYNIGSTINPSIQNFGNININTVKINSTIKNRKTLVHNSISSSSSDSSSNSDSGSSSCSSFSLSSNGSDSSESEKENNNKLKNIEGLMQTNSMDELSFDNYFEEQDSFLEDDIPSTGKYLFDPNKPLTSEDEDI